MAPNPGTTSVIGNLIKLIGKDRAVGLRLLHLIADHLPAESAAALMLVNKSMLYDTDMYYTVIERTRADPVARWKPLRLLEHDSDTLVACPCCQMLQHLHPGK
jgi:hypothetical protein